MDCLVPVSRVSILQYLAEARQNSLKIVQPTVSIPVPGRPYMIIHVFSGIEYRYTCTAHVYVHVYTCTRVHVYLLEYSDRGVHVYVHVYSELRVQPTRSTRVLYYCYVGNVFI